MNHRRDPIFGSYAFDDLNHACSHIWQILPNGELMGTLQRCDHFGIRSLLGDEPRAYDVLATTPVVLARIERETLIEITGPLTELVEMSFTREVRDNVPLLYPVCQCSPRRPPRLPHRC